MVKATSTFRERNALVFYLRSAQCNIHVSGVAFVAHEPSQFEILMKASDLSIVFEQAFAGFKTPLPRLVMVFTSPQAASSRLEEETQRKLPRWVPISLVCLSHFLSVSFAHDQPCQIARCDDSSSVRPRRYALATKTSTRSSDSVI